MKTSARNQFDGTMRAIRGGAISDGIEIEAAGGPRRVATVTRASREALGLAVGASAFGLTKASPVVLSIDRGDVKLSARNRFAGTVVAGVVPGAADTEMVLELPGGAGLAAVVTNESAQSMALAAGAAATAMFMASSAIGGVPA